MSSETLCLLQIQLSLSLKLVVTTSFKDIPYGIVVSVKACRAGGPGSIPEVGNFFFFLFSEIMLRPKMFDPPEFLFKIFGRPKMKKM